MADTTTSILQRGINNNTVCNKTNDYQIVLGSIDGYEIANSSVMNFAISEDIFSLLPVASFDIADAGTLFDNGDLYVGQTVYIQFAPIHMFDTSDVKTASYMSMRAVVLSIDAIRSYVGGQTTYHVLCCYDAVGVLGGVHPYPPKSIISPSITATSESSVNAIKAQLNAGGLDVVSLVDSADSMIWINTRNKICQCVNKFLEHSWISEEDAMLAFTSFVNDKSFNENSDAEEIEAVFSKAATITSCNTLKQKTADAYYLSSSKQSEHANSFRFANVIIRNHAGISTIANNAYKQLAYIYDPLGELSIDKLIDYEFADNLINDKLTSTPRLITGELKIEFDNPEVSMAAQQSKLAELYNYTNGIVDGGVQFDYTHAHYNVAPAHNTAVLASFFNTILEVTMDMNQQADNVLDANTLPYIGQKISIDCASDKDTISENYSGEYIVAQVKYFINNNEPAKCVLTVVSDGTYKAPTLSE